MSVKERRSACIRFGIEIKGDEHGLIVVFLTDELCFLICSETNMVLGIYPLKPASASVPHLLIAENFYCSLEFEISCLMFFHLSECR
jgi:hypothetical protein